MIKKIGIRLGSDSWLPNSVPSDIQAIAVPSLRDTKVLAALLHTAIWTRPPRSTGFDLSDMWAWLRYAPAIAGSVDLRLRAEWVDIDPHQKTILSDELGVGFTTQLFAEMLDFRSYADTNYILSLIDTGLPFKHYPKHGPAKSPDYLALDGNGQVSILECKGTQNSVKSLTNAIKKGIAQKSNLNLSSTIFRHSLVAGLFIPQWTNSARALIQISDPVREDLITILTSVSQESLSVAILQISFAKHFALMGLYSLANALTDTKLVEGATLQLPDSTDVRRLSKKNSEYLAFELTMPVPPNAISLNDEKVRGVRFRIQYPRNRYDQLVHSTDLSRELFELGGMLPDNKWLVEETDTGVKMVTPLGFELSLELEI